jgi:hypothetical protein
MVRKSVSKVDKSLFDVQRWMMMLVQRCVTAMIGNKLNSDDSLLRVLVVIMDVDRRKEAQDENGYIATRDTVGCSTQKRFDERSHTG